MAFLEGPDTDLALQSIERLKMCAEHLAKGDLHILPPVSQGLYATFLPTHGGTEHACRGVFTTTDV